MADLVGGTFPDRSSGKERILIVDDEPNARKGLADILREEGYDIREATDGEEALAQLVEFAPAAVLTDVRMPRMDGITLLKRARELGSEAVFVMMTAFASIETAVEAMRAGAENYLVKPLDDKAVLVVLEKALEKLRLKRDTASLRERVRERYRFHNIVGDAPELQAVYEVVKRAAPTRATVLILGESGTGKELIAQALHEESERKDKPFIKVNCAALSETLLESELFGHEKGSFTGAIGRKEGRFELADGGTLFLDEIGDISPALQIKLLRVLQQKEFERVGGVQTIKVDVRVVAATNRDLAAEVKTGKFREDLYYRLNVVAVTLPPLRQRKGDIPALVTHFVEKYAKAYGKDIRDLAPGTLNALLSHDWPGNVRELENVVERAVVLCKSSQLTADDLPPTLRGPRPSDRSAGALIPGATLYDIEREAILRTLEIVGGSTSRAAEILGISVRKIQYRLKEYGSGGRRGGGEDEGEEQAG
ncbi:sigma-54-dependent transcriptional regulator [Anaeromyxobacter paludicola]|uniref:Acetoacetate metabolism regulatory protein AtoC n=1 Tax=Anaeromyxobacter paludicola TaxID=2918171 RepID=A0ABM7X850_9BACT|nr:sigma-54 dependent transcriptional regulator [Anaeromyxobacter paludicola]BDG08030.1 acetoacetate metabolism regulatory protein AtoC [Anaeromyxobacter paludicola]